MSEKTKIYVSVTSSASTTRTIATALAEDGNVLARQEAPSLPRAKHALCITSGQMNDVYAKAYPNGYELEFVGQPERHEAYMAAVRRGEGGGQTGRQADEITEIDTPNPSIVDDLAASLALDEKFDAIALDTARLARGIEAVRASEPTVADAPKTSIVNDLDVLDQIIAEAEQEAIPDWKRKPVTPLTPEELAERVFTMQAPVVFVGQSAPTEGENLGDAPFDAVVPPELEQTAREILGDGQQEISLPDKG